MLAAHLMIGWQFDLYVGLPLAAVLALLVGPSVRRHMDKHAEGDVFDGGEVAVRRPFDQERE